MRGHYERTRIGLRFRSPSSCAHRRRSEAAFGALAPGENKFASRDRHAMQLRGVIQAEQAAFHAAARGEFRHHRRQMAARSLDSPGRFQFREETDNHAQSLPTAAAEGKLSLLFRARAFIQLAARGRRFSRDRCPPDVRCDRAHRNRSSRPPPSCRRCAQFVRPLPNRPRRWFHRARRRTR